MGMRILSIVLLLASAAFGAEAKITGPAEAKTGDLVVISAKDSSGKAFKWVMPPDIQTLSCSELEFGFASGTPGVYTFTLIAADTDDTGKPIDIASHSVRIGGGTTPDPTPDPPEDPSEPTPAPGDYSGLMKISKEAASQLNDSVTAKGLAVTILEKSNEIAAMCERGQCPTLDGAKQLMVSAIENRLTARIGDSRFVNWLGGWRKPINDALRTANTTTVANYLAAMRAIAAGLSES